jgi:hypothetical protein
MPSRPSSVNHQRKMGQAWVMRFGAGWYHKVDERPRKILKARVGGIALLRTLEPNKSEKRKNYRFFKY